MKCAGSELASFDITGNDQFSGVTIQCGECIDFKIVAADGVEKIEWTFEGGNPGSVTTDNVLDIIEVCYDTPGTYGVKAEANDRERTVNISDFVIVSPKEDLVANFDIEEVQVPIGTTIRINDLSVGNPVSYSWTVGNGSTTLTSEMQNPEFVLQEESTWNVSLTVTNGSQTSTEVKEDFIETLGYDKYDCLLQREISDSGLERIFTYNANDQVSQIEEYQNGQLITQIGYEWNPSGSLIGATFRDALGEIKQSESYTYDVNQFLLSQEIIDTTNVTALYTFQRDNEDFIISADLNLNNGLGGVLNGQVLYNYDQGKNNIVKEEVFLEGNLFTTTNFQFDDKPRLLADMKIGFFPFNSNTNNIIDQRIFASSTGEEIITAFTIEYNEFGRPSISQQSSGGDVITFTHFLECRVQF